LSARAKLASAMQSNARELLTVSHGDRGEEMATAIPTRPRRVLVAGLGGFDENRDLAHGANSLDAEAILASIT
jgi:hypothetical protein